MRQLDFRGYSSDCLIQGRLVVPAEFRLTDFLNKSDSYPVLESTLYALEDGRGVPAGDQQFSVGDLMAVEPTDSGATPWRADLRKSTQTVQVEVDMSPYRVTGSLHGAGTEDPLEGLSRRGPMVPLTDAVVHFKYVGREMARECRVLIVNRKLARSIRRAESPETEVPAESAPTAAVTADDQAGEGGDQSEAPPPG